MIRRWLSAVWQLMRTGRNTPAPDPKARLKAQMKRLPRKPVGKSVQ